MFIYIGKPKGISSLNNIDRSKFMKDRHLYTIAVVDDEPFTYSDLLRKHDFNIKELGDISDIKALKEYQIILCDIKGVGSHFGSSFEGGHVIEEIHRYYPSKILIAYTAYQLDPTYNRFFNLCDYVLQKDADSDEWVSTLVDSINMIYDPLKQWKRIRYSLIDLDVDAYYLMLLEQKYTNAITNGTDFRISDSFAKKFPADARQIIINFASAALFSILS